MRFINILFIATFALSCIPSKKTAYLSSDALVDSTYFVKKQSSYLLMEGDVLKVEVIGLDPNISLLFNSIDNNGDRLSQNSIASILLDGYAINSEGNIILPMIGSISVINKTLDEASISIQEVLDKYFINANAKVNLVSFKVTVLGEVKNPGVYYNYNKQLSVFEAIGLAGDLTEFGDRENLLLVRAESEGKLILKIDLSQQEIFSSDYYYLLPGDFLYVPPFRGKTKRVNIPVLMLVFTAITTGFLILNYFK